MLQQTINTVKSLNDEVQAFYNAYKEKMRAARGDCCDFAVSLGKDRTLPIGIHPWSNRGNCFTDDLQDNPGAGEQGIAGMRSVTGQQPDDCVPWLLGISP